jgi:hypothetical protein
MAKFTHDLRAATVAAATANNTTAAGVTGITNRNGSGKLAIADSGLGYNVGRYDNTGNWYSNNAEVDNSGGVDGTDQYVRAILPPRPSTGDYKSFGLLAKGYLDSYVCGVGAYWQNSAGAGTVPNLWIEFWLNTTGRTNLYIGTPSFSGGWNPTRWHAVELHVWLDGSVIKSEVKSWQAGSGFTPPANGSSWATWIAGMGTVVTQTGADYTPSAGQIAAGINTGTAKILQSIEYHYSSPALTPVDYAFLEVEESAGFVPLSAATTAAAGVLTATASDAVGAVTFQWYGEKDSLALTPGSGNIIAGATSQTYTPNPPLGEIWGYRCVVTDSSTPTPQTATTTAYPGERAWPAVGTLPAIASAYTGTIAMLCIGDSISEPFDYQAKLRTLLLGAGISNVHIIDYNTPSPSGTNIPAASGSHSGHWLGDVPYNDGSGLRNIRVTTLAALDSYRTANPGVPVIATMLLDTNDIQNSISLATTRAWLELLKSEMDSRSIPLVVAAPPWDMIDANHGHRTLVYRGDRRDHAASLGLVWAAGSNTMGTWRHRKVISTDWNYFANSEYVAPDWNVGNADVHPNTAWHTEFARLLYEAIRLNVIGILEDEGSMTIASSPSVSVTTDWAPVTAAAGKQFKFGFSAKNQILYWKTGTSTPAASEAGEFADLDHSAIAQACASGTKLYVRAPVPFTVTVHVGA